MNAAEQLISNFIKYIIDPTILLIFVAGFFLFLWGLMMFMLRLSTGGDTAEGRRHMLTGILGMLIMISVYAIIAILDNTFKLQSTNPDVGRMQSILTPADFGPRK